LGRAIEVVVAGDAGLHRCLNNSVDDFVAETLITDPQGPADTVELVLAPLLVLGLAEKGKHAGVIPSDTAALSPAVVVCRRAAHVDHTVQRRGAAQHLATGLIRRTTVEARHRLALEPPVVGVVRIELVETDRDVNPR